MTRPDPLLSIRDLDVGYVTADGILRAVDRVSLDVGRGEILGLCGESGSGKSTIVQAALRILPAPGVITGGSVRFDGEEVLTMDEAALRSLRWRRASVVFQSALDALNPVLTIGAQIADTLLAHESLTESEIRRRTAELLTLVDVDPGRAAAYPHELSGGQRQRVIIAIALTLEPALVVMDEPTTALDVVVERAILARLLKLRAERGFSILFITHDLPLLLELADRVAVMYSGRLVEVADAAVIRDAPRHPYTRGLVSSFPTLHGALDALAGIPGAPPSLAAPPSGCRFHPRCNLAVPSCATAEPPLLSVTTAPAHRVRCPITTPPPG